MIYRPAMACRDCQFFDGGCCRRLPPTTVPTPPDNQYPQIYYPTTWWPSVKPDDWCGEFRKSQA